MKGFIFLSWLFGVYFALGATTAFSQSCADDLAVSGGQSEISRYALYEGILSKSVAGRRIVSNGTLFLVKDGAKKKRLLLVLTSYLKGHRSHRNLIPPHFSFEEQIQLGEYEWVNRTIARVNLTSGEAYSAGFSQSWENAKRYFTKSRYVTSQTVYEPYVTDLAHLYPQFNVLPTFAEDRHSERSKLLKSLSLLKQCLEANLTVILVMTPEKRNSLGREKPISDHLLEHWELLTLMALPHQAQVFADLKRHLEGLSRGETVSKDVAAQMLQAVKLVEQSFDTYEVLEFPYDE